MTPDQAIEMLERIQNLNLVKANDDAIRACKLGIEALKFRLRWEQQEGDPDYELLPGEAE